MSYNHNNKRPYDGYGYNSNLDPKRLRQDDVRQEEPEINIFGNLATCVSGDQEYAMQHLTAGLVYGYVLTFYSIIGAHEFKE